ncbi:MAG TPA: hypothetical protein VM097_01430 [Mycobacteriales bacterium]|nr:hypothetical protein [Mycobacteriales bacterium]
MPEGVRSLAPAERRLAWAVSDDGTPLVATHTSLYAGELVLPWTRVAKVGWQPPVLSVRELADVDDTGPEHRFTLTEDAGLAETVRTQVTSSVAWSEVRRLDPRGKVRLIARRVPGVDALLWQVVWLDGSDSEDPSLRAQADALVAALRGTLG